MTHFRLEDFRASKEQLLTEHGILVPNETDWGQVPENHVMIVLLCDKQQSTALIILDRRSLKITRSSVDKRVRKTYFVPIEFLLPRVERDCAELLQRLLIVAPET